jgi:hypothetical protein
VLVAAAFRPADAQAQLDWTPRAPMPIPVARAGSGVVDRTLVVLGGLTTGTGPALVPTAAVQAYDTDRDAWRLLAPLPEPRFSIASAELGGTIYLAGGASAVPPVPLGSVLAYDVDGPGAVRPLGSLATPRLRAGAAVLNGRLYVAGGEGRDPATGAWVVLSTVEELDLASGAPLPGPPLTRSQDLRRACQSPAKRIRGLFGSMQTSEAPVSTSFLSTCCQVLPPSVVR